MPPAAGIATLIAMAVKKILGDKGEKKKRRRGKQREAAGEELRTAVNAPAPTQGILPGDQPDVLTGQVLPPTVLDRIFRQQGREIPYEAGPQGLPEWLAQAGSAGQLGQMGVPVDPLFVGMQGEFRKPIGAQERLDASKRPRKRTGAVRPEAEWAAREGGQFQVPGGQVYQSSGLQRGAAKEQRRTARATEAGKAAESQRQEELTRITTRAQGWPLEAPLPQLIQGRIVQLGGPEALQEIVDLRQDQLTAERATQDRVEREEGRGALALLESGGPENPHRRALEAQLYGLDRGGDVEAIGKKWVAGAERQRQSAERESMDSFEVIAADARASGGTIDVGLAEEGYRAWVDGGGDPQKGLVWRDMVTETDPDKKLFYENAWKGTLAAWQQEQTEKRLEADLTNRIRMGYIREEQALREEIRRAFGDASVQPSPAMEERMFSVLAEVRAEAEAAGSETGGSDGTTPPPPGSMRPTVTPRGKAEKASRYKATTGGRAASAAGPTSAILWDSVAGKVAKAVGQPKQGHQTIQYQDGSNATVPVNKPDGTPRLQPTDKTFKLESSAAASKLSQMLQYFVAPRTGPYEEEE